MFFFHIWGGFGSVFLGLLYLFIHLPSTPASRHIKGQNFFFSNRLGQVTIAWAFHMWLRLVMAVGSHHFLHRFYVTIRQFGTAIYLQPNYKILQWKLALNFQFLDFSSLLFLLFLHYHNIYTNHDDLNIIIIYNKLYQLD